MSALSRSRRSSAEELNQKLNSYYSNIRLLFCFEYARLLPSDEEGRLVLVPEMFFVPGTAFLRA